MWKCKGQEWPIKSWGRKKLLAVPNIKTNDRAIVMNSMWYWTNSKRLVEQSRASAHIPIGMITWFMTSGNCRVVGKASLLNIWCCVSSVSIWKKSESWTHFIPHTKIKSKWIVVLHVEVKSIKLLEENKEHFHGLWDRQSFLLQYTNNIYQRGKKLVKLRTLVHPKSNPQNRRRYLQNTYMTKALKLGYIKNSYKSKEKAR